MTTIVQPRAIHFTLPSADGLAAAFVAAALDDAGFGGHGFPSEGAPFALVHAAIQEGLDGDRPASVIADFGGFQASPGWDDQGGVFSPLSPVFSGEGEVEVYLNGATGAWWIAEAGVLRCLCTRVRRFHADLSDGVFSRYLIVAPNGNGRLDNGRVRGLRHDGGVYDPALHVSPATRVTLGVHFFSPIGPIGLFGGVMGARLPDTLPPTVAPIFPILHDSFDPVPPVYMGDLLDLMLATDGFAPGVAPLPGWRLLKAAPEVPFFYVVPMPPA